MSLNENHILNNCRHIKKIKSPTDYLYDWINAETFDYYSKNNNNLEEYSIFDWSLSSYRSTDFVSNNNNYYRNYIKNLFNKIKETSQINLNTYKRGKKILFKILSNMFNPKNCYKEYGGGDCDFDRRLNNKSYKYFDDEDDEDDNKKLNNNLCNHCKKVTTIKRNKSDAIISYKNRYLLIDNNQLKKNNINDKIHVKILHSINNNHNKDRKSNDSNYTSQYPPTTSSTVVTTTTTTTQVSKTKINKNKNKNKKLLLPHCTCSKRKNSKNINTTCTCLKSEQKLIKTNDYQCYNNNSNHEFEIFTTTNLKQKEKTNSIILKDLKENQKLNIMSSAVDQHKHKPRSHKLHHQQQHNKNTKHKNIKVNSNFFSNNNNNRNTFLTFDFLERNHRLPIDDINRTKMKLINNDNRIPEFYCLSNKSSEILFKSKKIGKKTIMNIINNNDDTTDTVTATATIISDEDNDYDNENLLSFYQFKFDGCINRKLMNKYDLYKNIDEKQFSFHSYPPPVYRYFQK